VTERTHPMSIEAAPAWEATRIENVRSEDAVWHFQVDLPGPVRVDFEGTAPPALGAPASLGLYALARPGDEEGFARRPMASPIAWVEVLGFVVPREMDPADLLVDLLLRQDKAIVSEQRLPDVGGTRGDVLATWHTDGREQIGRYYACKWGRRMFVLCMTTAAADYPALAGTFFAILTSMRALGDAPGPFAEATRRLVNARPAAWKTVLPASWEAQPTRGKTYTGFHALQAPLEPTEAEIGGALSFSVLDRAAVASPRAAANTYLDLFRRVDTHLEREQFEEEEARPPFKKSWVLVTGITRPEGEARCRVLLNDRAWVVVGVWGPTRANGPLAWMQNKRTLDLVSDAVEV
jgi:hypothetical protein